MSKRILIITYYWPPAGGAGVQRWLKFVKYLPEFGYIPYVLTVDPDYATYPVKDPGLAEEVSSDSVVITTKTREPFGLYQKIFRKKEVPYSGFANEKEPGLTEKISRVIRGNLFIPDARKGWNRYALPKAREIIREDHIGSVVTSGPPHSTHLIGLSLKKETGLPWIADFRDPWTDIYYYDKLYHSTLAKKRDSKLEKEVLENADKVIVVSREMKKMLTRKTDSGESDKISVIPNGFDEEDFLFPAPPRQEKFTITYTGTITEEYDIGGFLQATSSLVREKQLPVTLQFVGTVSPQVKELIRQYGLEQNTVYHDQVPHREVLKYMTSTTVLLLAIPNKTGNKAILTGKLFEYLAAGRPVLAIGPPDGEAAGVLKETNAGKMFYYDDLKNIKSTIWSMYKSFSAGSAMFPTRDLKKYSRRSLTGQLANILSEINK